LTAALLGLAWLSGCAPSLTLGPKVEDRLVFIKHKGIAARVAEPLQAKLIVEKDGKTYTQKMDIGGFYVISPDEAENKSGEEKK
jgi:hypothetical protein